MSVSEQLFFDPGALTVEQAGVALASGLGLDVGRDHRDVMLWKEIDPELGAPVGGRIVANDYGEEHPEKPEDIAVFDSIPMFFRLSVPKTHYEHQQAVALILFKRLVDRLGWPCVLTHEFEHVIATYDQERGVRMFPPGTRSDGTDEHLWR